MHSTPDFLQALWFVVIGVLWAGFFVLEGFDFGVGMLIRFLGRDEAEKRTLIHTIGPVWDGNEVWLITAGGAMFAAFPNWYATAFSGFYLAFFLVLAALIVRGVSFEFWGKSDSPSWRSAWEWAMAVASGAAAVLFGVAWANFVEGVPMGADHVVHVSLLGLLNPYALLGGLTTLTLFLSHGAAFLTLRTKGALRRRAQTTATLASPLAAVATMAFLGWTVDKHSTTGVLVLAIAAALAVTATPALLRMGRGGFSFMASAGGILLLTSVLCVALYPDALPSSTSHAFALTLAGAASGRYTLEVMSVVAVIFVPIVVGYQAWTYWVFRHRLGHDDYDGPLNPLAVLASREQERQGRIGATLHPPTDPPAAA